MSTTFGTIFNDLKTSAKLAWKSMLSYFLANLGMLIVMAILAVIVAIPVAIVAWALFAPLSEATMTALADWAIANPLVIGGIGLVILIPLVSLFLVVSGSIYGMSYELVTKGETKAELAFSYFRHKFLSFFGTGAVLTVIVLLPPTIAWGLTSIAMGYTITAPATYLLTTFTFVWVYLTAGLTSMVWPAVASGKGVQDAVKESFSLSIQYFDRVYGVLTAIVLLLVATFGPIILLGLSLAPTFTVVTMAMLPAIAGVGLYTIVMAFLWLLLFLPMVRIAWVKVYQELTGGKIATQSVVDMPIV
ncbi:MAG: hypothetical protein ACFFFK_06080 [Candidatus Thorarchaeota archaeon]